jgi:DNA-binding winged helix-turn-helix (wHTH) protein/TolB-like protein
MLTGRVRFGAFEADLASGELWRAGVQVPVQDLPFRLLTAFLERPGELVTRVELAGRLWGSGTFVDAVAGLNTAIAKLREALGDNADRPQYIETVPKRGYRFIAPVEPAAVRPASVTDDSRVAVSEARPRSRPTFAWIVAAGLAALTLVAIIGYRLRAEGTQVRIAVVLFDNETGKPELGRLAQGLTDATVTELTAEPRLAVIGNATILRTARPFRDIEAVRDALGADYVVIGQVQTRDDGIIVRAHLIRARDQAHLWVDVAPMASGETAFQSDVAARVRTAVTNHVFASR